jgi:threonine dehydrogenase-like Zn-dependent dehydrogenase
MIFPALVVGGGVAALGFGAVKAAASIIIGAKVVGMRIREWRLDRAARLDMNQAFIDHKKAQNKALEKSGMPPLIDEQDMTFLAISDCPGFDAVRGEWLLTEDEMERLDRVLEKLGQGEVPADLERLQWARKARFEDETLRPFIALKRVELQKQEG